MSKRLVSKKTGLETILTEEEYALLIKRGTIPLNRFVITDLTMRSVIPSLKEEVKIVKKSKNEG